MIQLFYIWNSSCPSACLPSWVSITDSAPSANRYEHNSTPPTPHRQCPHLCLHPSRLMFYAVSLMSSLASHSFSSPRGFWYLLSPFFMICAVSQLPRPLVVFELALPLFEDGSVYACAWVGGGWNCIPCLRNNTNRNEPDGFTYLPYYIFFSFYCSLLNQRGRPRGVMVKAVDCGIVVSEFELAQLRSLSDKYPWERYEPPYPPSYGLNSITAVLLKG